MCTSINDTKAVLRGSKQLCGLHLVALSPYRCPLSEITQAALSSKGLEERRRFVRTTTKGSLDAGVVWCS